LKPENAQLTQRAYPLGKATLQGVCSRVASRWTPRWAAQVRVDALKARYRLLVDAHLIWE
jgi:outer membrane protein, heavy metal efflux system